MHSYYDPLISPDSGPPDGLAISLGDEELFGLLDEFSTSDSTPGLTPNPGGSVGVGAIGHVGSAHAHVGGPHNDPVGHPVGAAVGPVGPVAAAPPRSKSKTQLNGQSRVTKKSSKSTLRSRKSTVTLKQSGPTVPLSNLMMAQSAGAAAGPHAYASVSAPSTQGDFRLAPAAAAAALRTPVKQENIQSPSTIIARSSSSTLRRVQQPPNGSIVAPSPTPATRMRSASKLVAPASDVSPAKGVFDKPKAVRRRKAPAVSDMSSAMGSFQVTLSNSSEAHPISVPKPPEKNMPPSGMVGVGAAGTVGASMAARAARASAQQYYFAPPRHDASMGNMPQGPQGHPHGPQGHPQGHSPGPHVHPQGQRPMYWTGQPQQSQQHQQPQPQHHSQHHSHHHGQTQPQSRPQSRATQMHAGVRPHSQPSQSQPSAPVRLPQPFTYQYRPLVPPPRGRGPAVSPYSDVSSSYSPPLEFDQKSLSPPVFSPPVSRSSSMRSPPEDMWMIHRQVETPPTPHATLKAPEMDEFAWADGLLDDPQWDLLSPESQVRAYQ